MVVAVESCGVVHWKDVVASGAEHYPGGDELLSLGSPLGRATGLRRLGIHHELLSPGRRTSWPHAECDEEEFVYVLEGTPDVWLDGHVRRLGPGEAVGFPSGTGVAHTFLNNTTTDVRLLVVGERIAGARVHYPLHPARNVEIGSKHWHDAPLRELGGHDGVPAPSQRPDARSFMPTLESERLVLRPLTLEDAEFHHEMRQDPDHVRFLLVARSESLESSRARMANIVQQMALGESKGWALCLKGETRVRGQAGIIRIDWENKRASVAYELRRADWGTGLMREAVARLVDYAFDGLGLHRVQAEIDPGNARSIRVAEGLGFELEGVLRGHSHHEGQFYDDAIYAKVRAPRGG